MKIVPRVVAVVALVAGATAGCDSKIHYEHAKVHGKVAYNGKPVTFGSVLFVPVDPPKDGVMQPASGSIGSDGAYELKSEGAAGAILGEHKVVVIAVQGDKPAGDADGAAPAPAKSANKARFKSAVPAKYADPASTPLTRKVAAGDNTVDLELVD